MSVKKGFFMPKYDIEFKKKCIYLFDNKMPLPTIEGVLPNALIRNVNEWKFLFKEQGEKGLSNEIIYKNYTLKDKIKACKRIVKGETYSEVSRSIGMSCHSTVRRWYLDYMKDGIVGLQYRKGIKPVTLVQVSKQMKKKLTAQEKEELIDHIAIRDKNHLEFHLKHVEGSGNLKTDALEVLYSIRKTQYSLEHYIVF